MLKNLVSTFCILFIIVGCSKAAKDIPARYISTEIYSDYTCEQIRKDLRRVSGRVAELTGNLDGNRSKDNMTTTAGIILFWPALFFIGGTKEQEAEYAQLKGEFNALEKVSISKDCSNN